MLALRNTTPFPMRLFAALDALDRDVAVVVTKGTFLLAGSAPVIAAEQVPLTLTDEHRGEAASSSVVYESDLCPGKPGTDVVLNGTAHAAGAVDSLVVELRAGRLAKRIAVIGERRWQRDVSGYRPSQPARFSEMELTYERAFGGRAPGAGGEHEPRNPVGTGFVASRGQPLEGAALPNLEDPAEPLRAAGDRPPPACFGFVHRSWAPRVALAGTCDENWKQQRAPFLPEDFDPRHHLAASPGLSSIEPFSGGEPIVATHVLPGGRTLAFDLPRVALDTVVRLRGRDLHATARIDTVIVEPDRARVLVVWRAIVPCPRTFLAIDRVSLRQVSA